MCKTSALPDTEESSGLRTYSETVAQGYYAKNVGGLFGKHDNVRTYWEDQLTQIVMRPFVSEIAKTCQGASRGVRILDLGCGSGQGYELLTHIKQSQRNLADELTYVLPSSQVDLFLGVDISDAMVEQGRLNYGGVSNLAFEKADLSEGLGAAKSEPAFDIYFSSYGSLSHLDNSALRRCMTEIIHHAKPGALIVLDLIGRYSPEWPGYWDGGDQTKGMYPYSMSYLYQADERLNGDVEQFMLRFWSGDEIGQLCRELSQECGVSLNVLELLDRSMFVGRHLDTREYNCTLPPLRGVVNRLYELNTRTNLESLRVKYQPVDGHEELNLFFNDLAMSWTTIVDFTLERIQGRRVNLVSMDGWRYYSPALQAALMTMDRVVDSVSWIDLGEVRSNILEPQLAYVLRRLEYSMQRGVGCGHGLVAVLQVGQHL